MKHAVFRRMLALVLALCALAPLCAPVFAAHNKGTYKDVYVTRLSKC